MRTSINLWLIEIRSSQFHDCLGHYLSVKYASPCIGVPIYDDFTSISSPLGVNLYKYMCDCEKKRRAISNADG